MRWLVTGGGGFIGRNLIRHLLASGERTIRVVDNLCVEGAARGDVGHVEGAGRREWMTHGSTTVELIVGDVRDETLAGTVTAGIDAVVHLAANTGVGQSIVDPRMDCLTNVVGTLNYLEACRANGVARFVFASSGASVGNAEPPLHEGVAARPGSPYGASKLAGEGYCAAYHGSFGVDTVALRFSNCYGPSSGHKSSIVARFIGQALAGEAWEIYGDGTQTRDFIYVDDVVDAIVRSATTPGIGGEVFQIATSTETTVADLADRLARVLGRYGVRPSDVRRERPRVGDVKRNYADVRKARERLGWRAAVGLDDGLERTVRWFVAERR
jgi:UDP-glucose 4-epimerase